MQATGRYSAHPTKQVLRNLKTEMGVRCDASTLEQSDRIVLLTHVQYLGDLVRAVSPTSVKPSTDIPQMAHMMAIHVYGSYLSLASDMVLSLWNVNPPQQVDQHFNVASDSFTTKTNHYHPQRAHIPGALKLNSTHNLHSLQCLRHTSPPYAQHRARFTVQSRRQSMMCTTFIQWVEHGPKPEPRPPRPPRPHQPRPIPSV